MIHVCFMSQLHLLGRHIVFVLSVRLSQKCVCTTLITSSKWGQTCFLVNKQKSFNLCCCFVFFSDLQKNEKKSWVKKLEHFVETKASTKVLETIKKEQCIMITGPFGSGKSMTAFNVALQLEDADGFDVVIVSDLDDIIKYATAKKKQLFVIDDMFGKYSLNDHNTGWWS